VKLPSLLRTSALRLALQYTFWYTLAVGVMLTALFWSSNRYVDAQLQADIEQELSSLAQAFHSGGAGRLIEAVSARAEQNALDEGRFYLLVTAEDRPLTGNLTKWPAEASVSFDGDVHNIWLDENILPGKLYSDDAYLPAIAREFADGSRLLLVRAVEQDNILREISEYLLESLAAVVFIALLMGVTMGRAILRRMDTISSTASEIMAGDLSQRVPVSGRNDEFDALAQRLNNMLERIEGVLAGMREVTDNVAHDLRSPITRIRNRMEVTLLERRDEKEYRDVMEQTIKDADTMVRTFNAILQTAQANAGAIRAELLPVDLSKLVREMGELYIPVAEEAGLTLRIESGAPMTLPGHRDLLAQAIGNLLDNAVKYTPRGGILYLELNAGDGTVDLVVEDSGPGIPEKEHHRVTQRFVRLDTVRRQEGNGLGLSLVDAIVRQHGATLLFEDNEPGLRAIIRFQTAE
jgi:signal transduction histidine kinase